MKTLIVKTKLITSLCALIAILPLKSFASTLTLQNNTDYIAQYVVRKGDVIVARIPGISPGAQLRIPTDNISQVVAATVIDGNTYTTAPVTLAHAADLSANLRMNHSQGTYEFSLEQSAQSTLDHVVLTNTLMAPVQISLLKDGSMIESVVLNHGDRKAVSIAETFQIYAIINGVTTDLVQTTNPNAVITATTDTSDLEAGYFFLDVQ